MEAKGSGFLTLNGDEVAALKKLLGESGSSVFSSGSFTTSDVELLGVTVSPDDFQSAKGGEGGGEGEDGTPKYTGLLPTALALVAPDVTPGHNSPISTSQAQNIIKPEQQDTPPAAPPAAPPSSSNVQERAISMLGLGGGGVPSSAADYTPSPESTVFTMAEGLSKMRRQQQKKKGPRGANTESRGSRGDSEEKQRLNELASIKLRGL